MILRFRSQIWIVAAIVSVSLLALVIRQTDLAMVGHLLAKARGIELLGALATLAAINVICSIRLVKSFGTLEHGRFLAAVDINIIHGLLLALLPARLGDAYYPVLLTRLDVRAGRALTNLLLLRLFDAAVVGTIFVVAGLSLVVVPGLDGVAAIALVTVLLVAALLGVALLPTLCRWIAAGALWLKRPMLRRVARQALDGRRWLGTLTLGRRIELFNLTILYWAASALMLWLVVAALGIRLAPAQAAFVASGLSLAGALPLQTVAGFGVAEASLTLLLMIVGFHRAEAASVGVAARLVLLALPLAGALLWMPPRWAVTRQRAVVR